MKSAKKCGVTLAKISIRKKLNKLWHKRCSSAGMFYTSSAGAVTSLILCAVLCGAFGLFAGADQASATASTLTISVAESVSLSILANGTTGTFATSDTSTNNISVKTTNGTGYTLGIKASTEGSNTLNGANSASIPSHTVTAGVSESNYGNDSYASTNNLNNTWGYRPSKLNSSANSNYLPGPTSASTPVTLDKTSVSNPSTANNYNLAIGARVTSSVVSGTYSNTFVITVVANPSIYSITYNKNTTDTVSNMPSNVVNQETSSETVPLASNTPTRTGYTFQGWCTAQVADGADCTGTSYAAGSNWTIDQTAASNSLTLYARWKASSNQYCTDWSTCMQNTTSTKPACGTTMTDGRDGNTYTTATIGGVCWMTQNLRFQGTDLKVDESDVTSPVTLTPYSLDKNDSSYTNHCDNTNGYNYACTKLSTDTNYGAYYNYCAASAGEVCNNSTKADATRSICPAGWKLPTQTQLNAVPSKDSHFTAAAGLAGFYYGGTLYYAGSDGRWWGSTAYSATYQYGLYYYKDYDLWDVDYDGKYYGLSVRCVRAS